MAYDSTNVEQLKYSRRKTMSKDYNGGWALTLLFILLRLLRLNMCIGVKTQKWKLYVKTFTPTKKLLKITTRIGIFYCCWLLFILVGKLQAAASLHSRTVAIFAAVAVPTISTISRFYCFLAISSWVLMESPTNLIYFIVLIPNSGRWQQDERNNWERQ